MDMRTCTHTIPVHDITHTFTLTNMHEFQPENQMIPDFANRASPEMKLLTREGREQSSRAPLYSLYFSIILPTPWTPPTPHSRHAPPEHKICDVGDHPTGIPSRTRLTHN